MFQKKLKIIAMFVSISSLYASPTIDTLFDALHKNPSVKENKLKIQQIEELYEQKKALLYPRVYGFASYDIYSTPMNITPLVPTESAKIGSTTGTYPFSKNFKKIGVSASVSLYDKSLFSLLKSIEKNIQSVMIKSKLDIIAKEGMVVEFNALLNFYEKLLFSLHSKQKSLLVTKEKIEVGMQNGKNAPADRLKLQSALSNTSIVIEDIESKIESIKNTLFSLTQIELSSSVAMRLTHEIKVNDIIMIALYKEDVASKEYLLEQAKDQYYPKLYLEMNALRGYGESYNNGEDFDRDFASLSLKLTIPLYDKTISSNIQNSKIETLIAKNTLEKKKLELSSQAKTFEAQLISLNKKNLEFNNLIDSNGKLLDTAKVALDNGKISIEEYLRYEDAVFEAIANSEQNRFNIWKIQTQLALMYGVKLSQIIE